MLKNCDFDYDFCLEQIDKSNASYFMFLRSWNHKFHFRTQSDEDDPYVYCLDTDGNFIKEDLFSHFLVQWCGHYRL